jgi:hypothetical protein
MPSGVQVYDASGALLYGTGTSIFKTLGVIDITADGNSYDARLSEVGAGKARFGYLLSPTVGSSNIFNVPTVVAENVGGWRVRWTYPASGTVACRLVYGVY